MNRLTKAAVGIGLTGAAAIGSGEVIDAHFANAYAVNCASPDTKEIEVGWNAFQGHDLLGPVIVSINGVEVERIDPEHFTDGAETRQYDAEAGRHEVRSSWIVDWNKNGKADYGEKFGSKDKVKVKECPPPTTTTTTTTSTTTTTTTIPETTTTTTTSTLPETTTTTTTSTLPETTTTTTTIPETTTTTTSTLPETTTTTSTLPESTTTTTTEPKKPETTTTTLPNTSSTLPATGSRESVRHALNTGVVLVVAGALLTAAAGLSRRRDS